MLPLSLGVPLAIVSVVGLCLNGYIFLVLVLTKQVSPNNILLVHLSITQTLLSLMILVFSFPPIIHPGSWIASIEILCILQGFIFTLLNPLSLWTICGLNCDRFYAIAAPLHYSAIVTNRKVIIGLISGWVVILFLSIPPFFKVAPFKFSTNLGACVPNFATFNSLWYAIIFTLVTLLVPGIVIVGCNIKVLMIARYHRHRIAAAIYEVTLSAQVTITHQRNPFFVPTVTAPSAGGPRFRSRSPVSSVLQLVGSFIILYLPYYVTIMWDSTVVTVYGDNVPDKFKTNSYVVIVSTVLLTCSTTVNSILYGLKSKTIRKTFQNYWRKKRTKSEINQEIQARTPSTCGSRRPSITNLGFLSRPLLQRRLSETLIDIDRGGNNNQRPKMKRIASELTWRPASLTFSGLESPTLPRPKPTLAHTTSCNTLQVPSVDNEVISEADRELYNTVRNSFRAAKQLHENPRKTALAGRNLSISPHQNHSNPKSTLGTANYLLQKVLRLEQNDQSKRLSNSSNSSKRTVLSSPLKSPRILITRAFSDESEKTPSMPGTPAKERLQRQYSSSTNLVDRHKWILADYRKQFDQRTGSSDMGSKMAEVNSGSNSTTMSDTSQRRYSSLEETSCYSREFEMDSGTEEQLLLSWPTTRKKLANKGKIYGGSSRNGLFRPSPLFNDRSEEPEVIL